MKAVVMAGGEGTRLRPMTCDLPKPLAPLCGKPVLEYLFDLLIRCGVDEAVVTLGYLAEQIRQRYADGMYGSLRLRFSDEPQPLGTAGSVRKAAAGFTEPFFVVSGDAVCDFDLGQIMAFHTASRAEATVAAYAVDDPREYGLVDADADGRIRRFLEKPSWGQATTDLANTGIYVLDPSCLSDIPEDKPFDFARDLFPRMLRRNAALYCCRAEGYWCDVGDVTAYLHTHRDLLKGRIRFPLKKAQDGVYVRDTLPAGDYTLVPPVFIDSGAQIGTGAVIGPYTSLGAETTVGKGARVRGSVLFERASVQAGAVMQDAVLCADAELHERASLFENAVVGSSSVIGAFACVAPDVRVWPHKRAERGASVREDVRFGDTGVTLFDDGGLDAETTLTAQLCVSLGAAVGSIAACRKTGIGCDGSHFTKAMRRALEAGILSAGGHVWDFGECFFSQLSYCTAFCGLPVGVFLSGGTHPRLRICGEGGLPLPRNLEREIESRMRRGAFSRCLAESCRDVSDMGSIRLMYARELLKQAPSGLRGMEASVQCANAQISLLMEETLLRLGCLRAQTLLLRISFDGTRVEAVTANGVLAHEKLLAVCCGDAFREGMDVSLPYDAPLAFDALAAQYGRKVHRYLNAPTDDADAAARRLSAKQIYLRDALYLAVRVLGVMHKRRQSLDALCAELPAFSLERRTFAVSFSPAKLRALFGHEDDADDVREGVSLRRGGGRLLITPDRSGKALHVLAEAANAETAAEMCGGFERVLGELEKDARKEPEPGS